MLLVVQKKPTKQNMSCFFGFELLLFLPHPISDSELFVLCCYINIFSEKI